MFAIVKFIDESDAPGIVCNHWIINENTTFYPNVKTNEARDKLLKKLASPNQTWSSCRIQILHKYSTFGEATRHLHVAEETSNLESSEDEGVSRRPRKRFLKPLAYPGEESEDDTPSQKTRRINPPPYPVPPTDLFIQSEEMETSLSITAPSTLNNSAACSSSQSITNGKIIAWMAEISNQIQHLNNQLSLILENQKKICREKVTEVAEDEENYEFVGSLPIVDEVQFAELNNKLAQEPHFRHSLIKILMSVGGKDMRMHTQNMLKRVIGDELAELYSLYGKSTTKNMTKKPFLSTEFSKIIFYVCQKKYKEWSSEQKIKEAIGDWLNQAKVRKSRRLERQEKQIQKNSEFLV